MFLDNESQNFEDGGEPAFDYFGEEKVENVCLKGHCNTVAVEEEGTLGQNGVLVQMSRCSEKELAGFNLSVFVEGFISVGQKEHKFGFSDAL